MRHKELAAALAHIALGQRFSETALQDAWHLPGLPDAGKELLHRFLRGTQQGTDHVKLQRLAAQIEEGTYMQTANAQASSLRPFTVIGFYEESGQIVAHHVHTEDGLSAFSTAAGPNPGMTMVVALPGHLHEGKDLAFPGEGLVDAATVLEQPDVFGEPPVGSINWSAIPPVNIQED